MKLVDEANTQKVLEEADKLFDAGVPEEALGLLLAYFDLVPAVQWTSRITRGKSLLAADHPLVKLAQLFQSFQGPDHNGFTLALQLCLDNIPGKVSPDYAEIESGAHAEATLHLGIICCMYLHQRGSGWLLSNAANAWLLLSRTYGVEGPVKIWFQARFEHFLGISLALAGNAREAEAILDGALAKLESIGDLYAKSMVMNTQARLLGEFQTFDQQSCTRAFFLFKQSLAAKIALNDHYGSAFVLLNAGRLSLRIGDLEEAGKQLDKAIQIAKAHAANSLLPLILLEQARLARLHVQFSKAETLLIQAGALLESGSRIHAEVLLEKAQLATAAIMAGQGGNFAQAVNLTDQALGLMNKLKDTQGQARALLNEKKLYMHDLGDAGVSLLEERTGDYYLSAFYDLEKCLATAVQFHDAQLLLETLATIGAVYFRRGSKIEAERHWNLLFAYCRRFEHHSGDMGRRFSGFIHAINPDFTFDPKHIPEIPNIASEVMANAGFGFVLRIQNIKEGLKEGKYFAPKHLALAESVLAGLAASQCGFIYSNLDHVEFSGVLPVSKSKEDGHTMVMTMIGLHALLSPWFKVTMSLFESPYQLLLSADGSTPLSEHALVCPAISKGRTLLGPQQFDTLYLSPSLAATHLKLEIDNDLSRMGLAIPASSRPTILPQTLPERTHPVDDMTSNELRELWQARKKVLYTMIETVPLKHREKTEQILNHLSRSVTRSMEIIKEEEELKQNLSETSQDVEREKICKQIEALKAKKKVIYLDAVQAKEYRERLEALMHKEGIAFDFSAAHELVKEIDEIGIRMNERRKVDEQNEEQLIDSMLRELADESGGGQRSPDKKRVTTEILGKIVDFNCNRSKYDAVFGAYADGDKVPFVMVFADHSTRPFYWKHVRTIIRGQDQKGFCKIITTKGEIFEGKIDPELVLIIDTGKDREWITIRDLAHVQSDTSPSAGLVVGATVKVRIGKAESDVIQARVQESSITTRITVYWLCPHCQARHVNTSTLVNGNCGTCGKTITAFETCLLDFHKEKNDLMMNYRASIRHVFAVNPEASAMLAPSDISSRYMGFDKPGS